MAKKQYSQDPKMKRRRMITLGIGVFLILLVLVIFISSLVSHHKKNSSSEAEEVQVTTEDGKVTTKVTGAPASATILSSGDYLIHKEIFDNSLTSDGTYDFNPIFEYVKDEISAADYAICDFEFTVKKDPEYTFYPTFQLPYSSVDPLVNAGFDMCVMANNHSADGREESMYRTLKVLRKKGLETTGTTLDPDDKNYAVIEVNGIKIGIVNYTFGEIASDGSVSLNGNAPLDATASQCINVFDVNDTATLYTNLQEAYDNMLADGAEATMAFMHWGNEYQTAESTQQDEIAQKLCDIGYNAIIGGHPHVIEPTATLTSSVDGHKTFCIYSCGNMVSNQRQEYIPEANGYTEDGIFVYTTFTRDEEGNVTLSSVDYTALWMDKYTANGKENYRLIPLSNLTDASKYNLSDNSLAKAKASKVRTNALVQEGVREFNS